MSCKVECEVLFNPANIGYLFQVRIQFLIADNRKYLAVRQLALVLFQNHLGNVQQGNIHVSVRLLTLGDIIQSFPSKDLRIFSCRRLATSL